MKGLDDIVTLECPYRGCKIHETVGEINSRGPWTCEECGQWVQLNHQEFTEFVRADQYGVRFMMSKYP
jgi:hypothetical protein